MVPFVPIATSSRLIEDFINSTSVRGSTSVPGSSFPHEGVS